MSSQLFGTDGIRGPAGTYPLNDTGMRQIGKAVAAHFTQAGEAVLVGRDPRESSQGLAAALIEGLIGMGVDVRDLGVIPTPGLAYLTRTDPVKAGVMITASHNPYTDNGVKVFAPDGRKLPDDVQDGLNRLISEDIPERTAGAVKTDSEAVKRYEEFLVAGAKGTSFSGLKVAVDTANGAASGIGEQVFARLGAQVTPLFDKPDGRNINVACGATDTGPLRAAVVDGTLDAGVAVDGDADRVILVDSKGRELTGDHLLYILAVTGQERGVVATIMSNQGLETALRKKGIGFKRTAVGDRSVLQGLDETGFTLGGEQSGHIIIAGYGSTGDGLLAAIQAFSAVIASGRSLDEWYDELELVPQALLSIPFHDKDRLNRPDIQAFIHDQERALEGAGRLNIRPSGTEPKVRIMVEAPDARERARTIAEQLTTLAGDQS